MKNKRLVTFAITDDDFERLQKLAEEIGKVESRKVGISELVRRGVKQVLNGPPPYDKWKVDNTAELKIERKPET